MTDTRKKRLLYKSKVEYAGGDGVYTCNHIVGCPHGCSYCYAYMMAHRFSGTTIRDWEQPRLVDDWERLLERDLAARRKEPVQRVFMSFSCDPFPFNPLAKDDLHDIRSASIAIIKTLNDRGIPVTTLSKGHYPWARLASLHPANEYGATITTLNQDWSYHYEHNALPPRSRLTNLELLAAKGCRTWVSIEPFGLIHPDSDDPHSGLEGILEAVGFAKRIVFGKANYCRESYKSPSWYRECAEIVREFCAGHGIECVIKKGTEQREKENSL